MRSAAFVAAAAMVGAASAMCPYMDGSLEARDAPAGHPHVRRDDTDASGSTAEFLAQFELNDNETGTYLTSDVGGPFEDQQSLSAGERGPTLLEDFIFRQKIQHFDHERVRSFPMIQWFECVLINHLYIGP